MSRSNPSEHTPNPATCWFEWNGEIGTVRYYDRDAKQNVDVGSDFTFILLDQLGTVRGWHEPSKSGIYSNEVKDTTKDPMVVKAFKGGTLAEGLYRDIKDRVNSVGGQFNANCYIAFKNGGNSLSIGSLRFKGAALGAWMEFKKQHKSDVYKKAVRIHGSTTGKKGRITYHMPDMKLVDITAETDAAAIALDELLQEFLAGYLAKNQREAADHAPQHLSDEEVAADDDRDYESAPLTDDDIPF